MPPGPRDLPQSVSATSVGVGDHADAGGPVVVQKSVPLSERRGEVGGERLRAGGGQLPAQGHRLLDRGQRILTPARTGQSARQVVQ